MRGGAGGGGGGYAFQGRKKLLAEIPILRQESVQGMSCNRSQALSKELSLPAGSGWPRLPPL